MGIKDKIKGWFSKKSKAIEVNTPSTLGNLNGLYVPNRNDINKIATKLNEVEDALNNLPPPQDLTPYATREGDNTFSGTNTFTKAVKLETFPEISRGNYEPTANKQLAPKFYVDKKVNEGVAGLDNKVNLLSTTLNNNITTATNATLADAKRYTDEKHDQQQVGINHLNDVVAKKTEPNTFSGLQSFTNISSQNASVDNIAISNTAIFNGNITNNNQLVTKEYVDGKVSANKGRTLYVKQKIIDVRVDTYVTGNIYFHVIALQYGVDINYPNNFDKYAPHIIRTYVELPDLLQTSDNCKCTSIKYVYRASGTFRPQGVVARGTSWTTPWKGNFVVGQNNTTARVTIELEAVTAEI